MSGENSAEKLDKKLLVDNLGENKLDVECRECPISFEKIEPGKALVLTNEKGFKSYFSEQSLVKWLNIKQVDPLTNLPIKLADVTYEKNGQCYFSPKENDSNLLEAVRDDWWATMYYIKDHRSWSATLCDPLKLVGIIVVSALYTVAAIGASLMEAANLTDKLIYDCISQVRSNLSSFSFSFFGNNNANNANNANSNQESNRTQNTGSHRRTEAVSDDFFDFEPEY